MGLELEQRDGRWWLNLPRGERFRSLGVTHIREAFQQPSVAACYEGSEARYMAHAAERLRDWGFNSAGYGAVNGEALEMAAHLPFVVSMEVLQSSFWRTDDYALSDIFDPAWRAARKEEMARHILPARTEPNLIGYAWTDTPLWRPKEWCSFFQQLPAEAPGKRVYVDYLLHELGSLQAVNACYGTGAEDRNDLLASTAWSPRDEAQTTEVEFGFMAAVARSYYAFCHHTTRALDARALLLGDRYLLSEMPGEVVREALPFIDILSVQLPDGRTFPRSQVDDLYERYGKPILICDVGINVPTEEHPRVLWPTVETEEEAVRVWASCLEEALRHPAVIGVHRCTYIDRVKEDGTLKQGLVRRDHTTYERTVAGLRRVHRQLEPLLHPDGGPFCEGMTRNPTAHNLE